MDIEKIQKYCLSKKGSTESFPFDETTAVYKVMSKMFCLLNLDIPHSINVKCDPAKAIELREEYNQIKPGYHMNKVHWNTIELQGKATDDEIYSWIDDSYNLIVAKLKKTEKEKLFNLKI